MNKFHEKIALSKNVDLSRKSRFQSVTKACYRGIILRSLIILAELLGYAFTKSQALWLDAISTSCDIGFSLFLVFSIKYASRPPDENHPFGHGRFEPVAGLQLSIILVILGGVLGFEQLKSASFTSNATFPFFTFLIPLSAAVILEACFHYFKSVARKNHSSALLSDAYHFRSDAIGSFVAALALGLGFINSQYAAFLDHMGALVIASIMIITGVRNMFDNLHQLLDKKPSSKYLEAIVESAYKVAGVLGTEKLRVQRYGPDAHVDIDIEVDPLMSVMDAHRIAQEVRASIQETLPEVQDVMVHVEPYFEADH